MKMNGLLLALVSSTLLSSCVLAIGGAGAGAGVGALLPGDDKTTNVAIGAGVGLAVGTVVYLALCFEMPGGAYSMGRDRSEKPWYCQ
jgi:hypothetical protein